MIIEFCCPVCKAPLAINKQVIGGQVNCPSCQKLILLPAESPLKRKQEDIPPFQAGQKYEATEVAAAICISVDPYRRDLESKSNLLNDAVEMVKIRNERIRSIETLMLITQKELWENEYDLIEHRHKLDGLQTEMETLRDAAPIEDPAQKEELLTLSAKKDKLKARLQNMVKHSENLESKINELRGMIKAEGPAGQLLNRLHTNLHGELARQETQNRDLDLAGDYLRQSAAELQRLQEKLAHTDAQRLGVEEKVKSSSEEMVLALEERNQWRKKCADAEKELEQCTLSLESLRLQASESEKLQRELSDDRDHSKRLRIELEDNLGMLRTRLEQERATHQETLAAREQQLKAEATKKLTTLENKLKAANAELSETEEKLADSLQTQQQLAAQNLQGEQQRRKLKAELEALQDQLDV